MEGSLTLTLTPNLALALALALGSPRPIPNPNPNLAPGHLVLTLAPAWALELRGHDGAQVIEKHLVRGRGRGRGRGRVG